MKIEITFGWDGDRVLRTHHVRDEKAATRWIAANARHLTRWYTDTWTCSKTKTGATIVDFGSHRVFARLTDAAGAASEGKQRQERKEEMKKEAVKKTTAKAVACKAKTIKKPQTIEVGSMKVVAITLTDKGTLVIKYAV